MGVYNDLNNIVAFIVNILVRKHHFTYILSSSIQNLRWYESCFTKKKTYEMLEKYGNTCKKHLFSKHISRAFQRANCLSKSALDSVFQENSAKAFQLQRECCLAVYKALNLCFGWDILRYTNSLYVLPIYFISHWLPSICKYTSKFCVHTYVLLVNFP